MTLQERIERRILGCVFLRPEKVLDFAIRNLKGEFFSTARNRTIFLAMKRMWMENMAIDVITVHQYLKDTHADHSDLHFLASLPDEAHHHSEMFFLAACLVTLLKTEHEGKINDAISDLLDQPTGCAIYSLPSWMFEDGIVPDEFDAGKQMLKFFRNRFKRDEGHNPS